MQKGCPKCGRMIDENLNRCPYCNYDFAEINEFFKKVETQKFIEEGKYAGLIKRLIAGMIDFELISIITLAITNILKINYLYITLALFAFLYIFILSIFERTKWHASLGKMIVGIEVVDEYENPITFGLAILRNITKFLNIATFGIGFLICVAPPKRQTLSDRITKTYVLNKVNFREETKHDYASNFRRFMAFIIDLIVIGIINYALIYAYDYVLKNFTNIPIFFKTNETIIKSIITSIISLLYFPINECFRGKTVGKRYMKIRLTNIDESKISFIKSLIREMLQIIDIITLGFLLPLTHNKKQTIKDIITKTIIING